MMDMAMTVNDTELRIKGIEALNRDLGPVLALRFLSLLHREPTDHVDVLAGSTRARASMRSSIVRRSSGADDVVVELRGLVNVLTVLLPRTIITRELSALDGLL